MTVNKKKQERKKKKIPILIEVTRSPQAISRSPILLAVTPLPRPLTTPPVTNMYFIFSFCFWFNSFQTKPNNNHNIKQKLITTHNTIQDNSPKNKNKNKTTGSSNPQRPNSPFVI